MKKESHVAENPYVAGDEEKIIMKSCRTLQDKMAVLSNAMRDDELRWVNVLATHFQMFSFGQISGELAGLDTIEYLLRSD
ncbi:hypothetical protein TNCV_3718871 [Trichonephila clavipes]|nr:hypothetical protein TNCV_3718871 [Trichonephila clavipes]